LNYHELPRANPRKANAEDLHSESLPFFSRVVATGSAFPDKIVTNQDIIDAQRLSVSANAMAKLVGVNERRVAPIGTVDTDLLALAAHRCLDEAQVKPDCLSKLIVTKFLGDRALPMTAALLQKKLDFEVAVQSYDVDGGTNSFLQALHLAECSIGLGDGPVLIVSGGVVNCLVSKSDPRLAFQFGDGAAAVLLSPVQKQHVLGSYFFSNYEYSDIARGFSVRDSVSETMYELGDYQSLHELYREGDLRVCIEFVKNSMAVTVAALLEKSGVTLPEVDLFLITENHVRIRAAIIEHLGIDQGKTISLRGGFGNTMSAMLPMQLDAARRNGVVKAGSYVMFLSLGEGLSGGGMLIEL
jgi:3-oxoacyl-[acyl-carrier-protein] synthase III